MLVIDNLEFSYPNTAFKFSLQLNSGDTLAIIGPSGSGKSSLLNALAGFCTPESGKIIIDDQNITTTPTHMRPITILFQEHNLFAHLNVWQNIAIGIKGNLKLNKAEEQNVSQALERVGLEGYANRLPVKLSGGQRQRVAFARALVRKKKIILLDEPFAALDPHLRKEMLKLLAELHSELNYTLLMVTHYLEDCQSLCNKTAFLEHGSITQLGETSLILNTEHPALLHYLGKN